MRYISGLINLIVSLVVSTLIIYSINFTKFMPPTIFTRNINEIKNFYTKYFQADGNLEIYEIRFLLLGDHPRIT